MINRFYKRTPYEGELYQPNVQLMASVLEQAQKKYDTNYALADELKNRYIDALPQDRAEADKIQAANEQRINDIVGKYNGDYSQATKDLYSLISDIKRDYNPGGKAHAIATNYKNYNDAIERERERLKKGEVVQEQIGMLQNYFNRTYTGIGEKDKVTGNYNMLNLPDLAKYVDSSKLIEEAYKSTPEQSRKVGRTSFRDGNIYYHEEEQKGKPYELLQQSFADALFGDVGYVNMMDQMSMLSGENLNQTDFENRILEDAYAYARTRAYMNTSDITKAQRDPVYLENLRWSHRKKDMEDLFGSSLGALEKGDYINKNSGQSLPDDWRLTNTSKYSPSLERSGIVADPEHYRGTRSPIQGGLYDAMQSGELKKVHPGANLNLLMAGAADMAAKQGFNLKDQSEEWKRNFFANNEKELLRKYNKDLGNLQVTGLDQYPLPNGASDELKKELIPKATSGGTSVFRIVNGKMSEFTKLKDSGINPKDLYDDNGRLKDGVRVVSYAVPGQGIPKGAFKVTTPNGDSFYVTDQNKDRYEHFGQIGAAHNAIFQNGEEWGGKFPVETKEGKITGITPRSNYFYDDSGNVTQKLTYWGLDEEGKMTLLTKGDGKTPADIYDVWDLEDDRIKSVMPLGAAKSDMTRFIYNSFFNE